MNKTIKVPHLTWMRTMQTGPTIERDWPGTPSHGPTPPPGAQTSRSSWLQTSQPVVRSWNLQNWSLWNKSATPIHADIASINWFASVNYRWVGLYAACVMNSISAYYTGNTEQLSIHSYRSGKKLYLKLRRWVADKLQSKKWSLCFHQSIPPIRRI